MALLVASAWGYRAIVLAMGKMTMDDQKDSRQHELFPAGTCEVPQELVNETVDLGERIA